MVNVTNALWIALGATLGAWSRWGLGLAMNAALPHLPLGTLLANLTGGLLMGMFLGLVSLGQLEAQPLKLLLTTGFFGGLTTFSAFTGESLLLLQKHAYGWAAIHISSHVFGALLMAAIGFALVQWVRS